MSDSAHEVVKAFYEWWDDYMGTAVVLRHDEDHDTAFSAFEAGYTSSLSSLATLRAENAMLREALERVVKEAFNLPKCQCRDGEACSTCEIIYVANKALSTLSKGA